MRRFNLTQYFQISINLICFVVSPYNRALSAACSAQPLHMNAARRYRSRLSRCPHSLPLALYLSLSISHSLPLTLYLSVSLPYRSLTGSIFTVPVTTYRIYPFPTSTLSSLLQVVFVVSGKELYAVSEFFGDVRGLGLGAEHGFYYRWPAREGDDAQHGVVADLGEGTRHQCLRHHCEVLSIITCAQKNSLYLCVR